MDKDEKMMTELLGILFGIIATPIVTMFLATVRGFCCWCMYCWYVVSLGTPQIGLWQFVGMLMLWAILWFRVEPDYIKDGKRITADFPIGRFFSQLFGNVVFLFVGWIIHFWA